MNMKKNLLFLLVLFSAVIGLHAETLDIQTVYVHSADVESAKAGAGFTVTDRFKVGVEGKYTHDKAKKYDGLNLNPHYFADPIYSLYVPMQMDLDLVKINITPFYYFKNDADGSPYQDNKAYGVNTQFMMDLNSDEVNELYTQAYIGVSYAKQKGTLFKDGMVGDKNYDQLAYTLGIRQNFFQTFTFHVAGTAFHYPNGIDGVTAFRGIMDQQDLAFTQTFEVGRQLGKYALSGRLTRIWADNGSTMYAAYRYGEFYTSDPEHSFLVGNSFKIARLGQFDVAYNHVQTTSSKNKRDILYFNLGIYF